MYIYIYIYVVPNLGGSKVYKYDLLIYDLLWAIWSPRVGPSAAEPG